MNIYDTSNVNEPLPSASLGPAAGWQGDYRGYPCQLSIYASQKGQNNPIEYFRSYKVERFVGLVNFLFFTRVGGFSQNLVLEVLAETTHPAGRDNPVTFLRSLMSFSSIPEIQ